MPHNTFCKPREFVPHERGPKFKRSAYSSSAHFVEFIFGFGLSVSIPQKGGHVTGVSIVRKPRRIHTLDPAVSVTTPNIRSNLKSQFLGPYPPPALLHNSVWG